MQAHKPRLLREVLEGVSRSFYLSLCALPSGMRAPAGLAYLLARASDTIADAEGIAHTVRVDLLKLWNEGLHDKEIRASLIASLPKLLVKKAENLPPTEATLLRNIERVFLSVSELPYWQQELIWQVARKIAKGQLWDVRFFRDGDVNAVDNAEDLIEYTYLVAGCVGEFWTYLAHGLNPTFASRPLEKMLELGASYGTGLQLTNILRDLPSDLERGRCYLPVKGAISIQKSLHQMDIWNGKAQGFLYHGLDYASSVRRRRLRYATALPALLGIKTLEAIKSAPWEKIEEGIKISKWQVRECLWSAFLLRCS